MKGSMKSFLCAALLAGCAPNMIDDNVGDNMDELSSSCGKLGSNKTLTANKSVSSCNKLYKAIMQGDGNFVLYAGNHALWASNTVGKGGQKAIMQGDGNLVVYDGNSHPLWASNTENHSGAWLAVQDDGNMVIYPKNGGKALWATNTVQPGNGNGGGGHPPPSSNCTGLPNAPNPHLISHGGPVISTPRVWNFFWGDVPGQSSINDFMRRFVTSSYVSNLGLDEYGLAQQPGSFAGSQFVPPQLDKPSSTITDADIAVALDDINASIIKSHHSNEVIVFWLAPGLSVRDDRRGVKLCDNANAGAYHDADRGWRFIVMPDCDGQSGINDTRSWQFSHELAETMTDPDSNGWFDRSGQEIGDLCQSQLYTLDGMAVQCLWSNTLNKCTDGL